MKYTSCSKVGFTLIELLIVIGLATCLTGCDTGGFGPKGIHKVLVTDKKIDISGGKESTESHYMVYGREDDHVSVYEVDNGLLLHVWNADELYANIEVGKIYEFETKGNKRVNFFMQEYPYIVRVTAYTETKLEQ